MYRLVITCLPSNDYPTDIIPPGSVLGPLLFNIFINFIIHASELFIFILYADDTTLNSTLDCHGTTTDEIE